MIQITKSPTADTRTCDFATPREQPVVETVVKLVYPFNKVPRSCWQKGLPWRWKLSCLFEWGGCSITEFGSKKINTHRHLCILGRHILTVSRNQYHEQSDRERAEEYLRKWFQCEKDLRGLRLLLMGESTNAEVKKVIRDSLGVDLDEGRIL